MEVRVRAKWVASCTKGDIHIYTYTQAFSKLMFAVMSIQEVPLQQDGDSCGLCMLKVSLHFNVLKY